MANLRVTELDFDSIKQNLKNFLSVYRDSAGDLVFSDYDFEGSGLSVLIDLLAYNTHYNAYLSNMLINEMFLDSAVKRESAVSIAKHLGYTPRSTKSARAIIDFIVFSPSGNPTTLTLDKYTPFSTTINNKVYTFVNLESRTITRSSAGYSFNNIEIVEGVPLEYVFRVNFPGIAEKYEIPNKNVDISTLVVTVQNSNTDLTTDVYSRSDDALGIDGTSKIYFLEESPTGYFNLVFGNNVLGKKLNAGNLVKVQYLISNGTDCNVSSKINQNFSTSTTIGGGSIIAITTVQNSIYGADKESISEIKFNAPRYNSSQNRAVSDKDYKVLIDSFYPALIESVAVWGGEDNVPKKYGKVMVALSPVAGYSITSAVKQNILNHLKRRRILSIVPEFVDPEYFYVNLTIYTKYDSRLTNFTSDEIKNQIRQTINNYFNDNLRKFDQDFIFSKLNKLIDETNNAIVGSLINLKIQKRITPVIGSEIILLKYNNIKFYVSIMPGSLQSTRYSYLDNNGIAHPVIMRDLPNDVLPNYLGTGAVQLINPITNTILDSNYGTINYGTGEIDIPSFLVYGLYDDSEDVRITIKPQDNYLDVTVNRNQIILQDDSVYNINTNSENGISINTISVTS